jgi:hypothetical protein
VAFSSLYKAFNKESNATTSRGRSGGAGLEIQAIARAVVAGAPYTPSPVGQVQNGAASGRFAFADAVLACKLTPEQYYFSYPELKYGYSRRSAT